MTRPLVTVVIPSFNGERYLADAVRSSLDQTYDRLEVVVVDDGSRIPQVDVLASIHDSRLRVIRQENAGVANARNRGAREGRGDVIALLDADDRWLPRKLEVQIPIMEAAHADIVFSDMHRFQGDTRLPETYQRAVPVPPESEFFRALIRRNFVALSTAVVTRRAFESVGGFCEDRSIWEDWDLWIRLATRWRFASCPDALTEYRMHDANASGDVQVLTDRALATLARLQQAYPGMFDEYAADLRHSRGEVWFNLGYARLRQGRVAEARAALRRAARLRPLHFGTWKDILRAAVAALRPKAAVAS